MKWSVKMKRHEQKTCSDFINFSLSFFRTASKLHMFSRINGTSKDFFPLLPSIFHRNISSRGCCSLLNRRLVFSKVWQDTGGSEEAHLVKPTSLTVPITKAQQDRTEAPGSTFPFFLKPPHWALRKYAERFLVISFQGHRFQGHTLHCCSSSSLCSCSFGFVSKAFPSVWALRACLCCCQTHSLLPCFETNPRHNIIGHISMFLKVKCPCF